LPQLVEQARILYGDDGLRGEVGQQRDLLFRERLHLVAVNADDPDLSIGMKSALR
jgi:hypothetical protein